MKGKFAAFLAALLCVTLTACSTIPEGMGGEEPDTPSVLPNTEQTTAEAAFGYIKGDSFNPYTAQTAVNRSFASLLYESLYVLDETLEPQPLLAETVPWSSNEETAETEPVEETAEETVAPPTEIEITLRKDARFSNGKAVTAADVETSFKLAKASSRYRSQLQTVVSLKARGDRAVVLKLSVPDVRYAARLTFPVVNEATAKEEIPLGSGVYYVAKTGEMLVANPHTPQKPQTTRALLKPYENSDAMRHALGTGQILLYSSDLASGEIPRVTAASSPLATSSLVFLGFNSQNAALTPAVRAAVNSALNRTEMKAAAFAGYADVATSPFHPLFGGVKKPLFRTGSYTEQSLSLLEEAGYRAEEESHNRKQLKLKLLLSDGSQFRTAAAEQIKQSLLAVGVTVTVEEKPYAEYLAQLKSGAYDLHLGEIRLSDDLDLAPLFNGSASYGVSGTAGAAYTAYRRGTGTIEAFLTVFSEELPFLPLCYRSAMLAYHRQLENVRFTGFNLFSHIQDWKIRE